MKKTLSFALFLSFFAASRASAEVIIIVRNWTETSGSYVRVCDIARVEGPSEEVAEIAKAVIGPTPPKGQTREITRWEIEQRLAEMGLEARVMFSGNETVKVFGNGAVPAAVHVLDQEFDEAGLLPMPASGRTVPAASKGAENILAAPAKPATLPAITKAEKKTPVRDDIDAATKIRVSQAIENYICDLYSRPDVEIVAKQLELSGLIPADAFELKVEEALGGKVPGKADLALRVLDAPDAAPRRVLAKAEVEVSALAPVAARQLPKGARMGTKDVHMIRIKMQPGLVYMNPDIKALANRELVRPLAPGTPILASDTVEAAAVRRGDMMTVQAAGRNWTVKGNGKALSDGKVGDIIGVEDSSNKTKYSARVTGRGEAELISAGKP